MSANEGIAQLCTTEENKDDAQQIAGNCSNQKSSSLDQFPKLGQCSEPRLTENREMMSPYKEEHGESMASIFSNDYAKASSKATILSYSNPRIMRIEEYQDILRTFGHRIWLVRWGHMRTK